ncbi:AAA family ATPase [Spirosoma pomorum]
MIFTVGGIKGGSGKTTISTNLAVFLSQLNNGDVLLVDADDQETASDFTAWREDTKGSDNIGYTAVKLSGEAVRSQVLQLKKKYEHVIIDVGGRDTSSQRAALYVTDYYLLPFNPRSFDVWTVPKVEKLISEILPAKPTPLTAFAFLNRADPRGADNEEAAEYIAQAQILKYLDCPIGNRKAFSHAAGKGLSVLELSPSDEKAVSEIKTLFNSILQSENH